MPNAFSNLSELSVEIRLLLAIKSFILWYGMPERKANSRWVIRSLLLILSSIAPQGI